MENESSKKQILIVEDQVIIALNLKQVLEDLGYSVAGIVSTGEGSIEILKNIRPDIVLMDIMLAGELDGISAAEIIRKDYDIPIIYLTAHTDVRSLERANQTGPYGYIVKPIEERDLYTSIEIALHRFEMDKAVKKSELKYRTLFEQSLDPIFIADENAVIIDANRAMTELFNYSIEDIIGHKAYEFFMDRACYRNIIEIARSHGSVNNFEAKMVASGNKIIDAQISIKKYDLEDSTGYQGIIRDITQYKLFFEEIIRSKQELRNLTAHIENLREQERTEIAREIHDVLGQSLTALRLDLSWLKKRLDTKEQPISDKLSTMENIINDIIFTVRKISSRLRPGILDDLGLAAAIEWQAEDFKKRTGIACNINCEDVGDIAPDRSIALFRIFQESLTNIMKHSCADRVDINLFRRNGNIEMIISDNGKGISEEDLKNKGSYGIIGMKERVANLNGTLTITGSPGATIKVVIPF